VLACFAQLSTNVLLPRLGPKVLVPIGLALAGLGMVLFAQIDAASTYQANVLPGLLVMGAGMGTAMPATIQTATLGVRADYAGVTSSVVSTAQQVGGAVGTAVLNTLATTAGTAYVTAHATTNPPAPQVMLQGALTSYTTAFWWSAWFFFGGAVITALLYRRRGASGGIAVVEASHAQ